MKIKRIPFIAAVILLCLTGALARVAISGHAAHNIHFQWTQTVADARTVRAAIEYLIHPEQPEIRRRSVDGDFATEPAVPMLISATNMTTMISSNQITATNESVIVPG